MIHFVANRRKPLLEKNSTFIIYEFKYIITNKLQKILENVQKNTNFISTIEFVFCVGNRGAVF